MAKRVRDESYVFDMFGGDFFAPDLAQQSTAVHDIRHDDEDDERKPAARDNNETFVDVQLHSRTTVHDIRNDMAEYEKKLQAKSDHQASQAPSDSFDCVGQPTAAIKKARCEKQSFEDNEEVTAWLMQLEHELEAETLKQLASEQRKEEEQRMNETSTGKAWQLVRQVVKLQQCMRMRYPKIAPLVSAVARDDMFFLAEAMLLQQEKFAQLGKPTQVDIGYHYTSEENVSRIRTDGLLTKRERQERAIWSKNHGSSYGDGVYTANDLHYGASGRFGDVGILVARLKGAEGNLSGAWDDYDSTVHRDIVVLRCSSQCLALFRFDRQLAFDGLHLTILEEIHWRLFRIVQTCFGERHCETGFDQTEGSQHTVDFPAYPQVLNE